VFDDDFFREPREVKEHVRPVITSPEPISVHVPEPEPMPMFQEPAVEPATEDTQWPQARVPSFAGYAGDSTTEVDELDIPAFLRRKH
jgi:hypothetical protein